jgi:hypothetical protein
MRVIEVLRRLAVYGLQKYFLAYDSFNFSVGAALTSTSASPYSGVLGGTSLRL